MSCKDHGQVGKVVTNRKGFTGGYGYTKRAWGGKPKRTIKLHRAVYCDYHKLSPDDIAGLAVRHTCDNPRCINPEHLILGTQQENIQDMMERGRHVSIRGVGSRLVYKIASSTNN